MTTPPVTLRELNRRNWEQCIRLRVRKDQEGFVASNLYSIAEARFYPTIVPLAVYAGEAMVGFVMYGLDPDDAKHWVHRLMIDEAHQGRGYGRAALEAVIERLRQVPGCREIMVSHRPDNAAARALYASLGFRPTGEMLFGEIVNRLILPESSPAP